MLEEVTDGRYRAARVLDGQRACPPEDVGGIGGYEDFLEAMANRRHPRHQEMMSWAGGGFDPEAYDIAGANGRLAKVILRPRTGGPVDQRRLVH